mmetsp:Transcript_19125/g.73130  ORF Transcript_19125/g.73130 Transcript_19125/m.73130 type:complete len:205 (+) Transcript_19125:404-1018(+)
MAAAAGSHAAEAALDLVALGCRARASTVLGGKKREYGPARAIDGDASTCWNSDQGVPQWLELELGSDAERDGEEAWTPRALEAVAASFQGGFAGLDTEVHASTAVKRKGAEWALVGRTRFADATGEQSVDLRALAAALPEPDRGAAEKAGVLVRGEDGALAVVARRLKVVFSSSSDFFGRVTVYGVSVLGRVPPSGAGASRCEA